MDRTEREMAQTERIVNQLVRQPILLPSVERRIEKNLARASEGLSEIDKKLKLLKRLRGAARPKQASRKVNAEGHRKREAG